MEITTIIAAITTAIKLFEALSGDKAQKETFEARLEMAQKLGEQAFEALSELYEEIAEATLLASQRRRAEMARAKNPAFWKGAKGAATVLLIGLLGLSAAGCSRLTTLEETPTLRAGYAYEWPADASRNPADYQTTEVEGRMITTVTREAGK